MTANDPSDDRRDEPNDGDDPVDRDESDVPGAGESGHWLSSLLSALEALQQRGSTTNRRRGDRTDVEYGLSIGTGLQPPDGSASFGSRPGGDRSDRPRRRRRSTNGHHLASQRYDDELVVTADVANADPSDVTVGFDDAALVVAVADRELGRVDLPWPEPTADAVLNNGVLTVEVRPTDGGRRDDR